VKRCLDIVLSVFLGVILLPVIITIAILIKSTSKGPVLFCSPRLGEGQKRFSMPKFRTMKVGTPVVGSSTLESPSTWITPLGSFLRRYSLDELPQLWSVLTGSMSLVGPRPALPVETELILIRERLGVNSLVPGLTGWAQINGRDGLSVGDKAKFDAYYLNNKSFLLDVEILCKTVIKVVLKHGVSH